MQQVNWYEESPGNQRSNCNCMLLSRPHRGRKPVNWDGLFVGIGDIAVYVWLDLEGEETGEGG